MNGIYVSLGSNLGERRRYLELALAEIKKVADIEKVSSLYESEPWGYERQGNFYNAVIELEVDLEPFKLLSFLKGIEIKLGRKKSKKWGPRVIDLDILLYGIMVLNLPKLKIPHPELKNRAFVLIPLLELNPELTHPLENKKLSEYLLNLESFQRVLKIASFNYTKGVWDETV